MSAGDTARTSYELASNQALERIRLRDNALMAFLGATGVIFGVAMAAKDRIALLLMIPYLGLAAVFIVTQHDRTIGALSAFVTEALAPYFRAIDEEAPLWERCDFLRRYASSAMTLRSLSHAILILVPVSISLSWTWQYARSVSLLAVCWWIAFAVGGTSTYLLISTYVERVEYYANTNWQSFAIGNAPVVTQQDEGSAGSKWPNAISCLRVVLAIALIPLFRSTFYWHYTATLLVFLLAALTDLMDGYVARKLRAVSSSGDVLDLVADRVLAIVAVVLLAVSRVANLYLCVLVIVRESVADSARALAVAHHGQALPHNAFGRAKFGAIVVASASGLLGLSSVLPVSVAVMTANASLTAALLLGITSVVAMRRAMLDRQHSPAVRDKQSEVVGSVVKSPPKSR